MNNKKKKKLPKFIKIMLISINLLTIIFLVMTKLLNVIPFKYFIIILILLIIIDLITSISLLKRTIKSRIIGILLSLLMSVLLIFGIYYECKTNDFLNIITNNKRVVEKYLVIVNEDSDYKNIKDISSVGILNIHDDNYKSAIEELDNKKELDSKTYDDVFSLVNALYDDDIDSFLIEDSQEKILKENYDNYENNTRVLYEFKIEYKSNDISKNVDITKNTFSIYISGIDTYGSILENARSDVNIIATVNPITHNISLVDIPRDYYVALYNKVGYRDKLTHAGIYGVETSVKSIEDLLDIDINYYVKFNFTSLIKIVDELGGVKVYSDETFESGLYDENTTQIYKYYKGYNNLNGKQALSFARERYAFNDGDRVRGKHQEALIEAILDKVTSPSIIVNYSSLLDALQETFVTNLDSNNLKKMIKYQINNDIKWNVTSFVLDGDNSLEYTYSYPKQKLYVMIPDSDSLNEAKEIINSVYDK